MRWGVRDEMTDEHMTTVRRDSMLVLFNLGAKICCNFCAFLGVNFGLKDFAPCKRFKA